MKFAIKPHDISHLTLGVLLHYFTDENRLRFDKVTESLKVRTFLRHCVDTSSNR